MRSIDLGPVDRIPLGEGRTYGVGGELVAVFRTRAGELFATQALCPHALGALADGMVGGGRVLCPLHGRAFDLQSGRCLSGGPEIRTYPITISAEGTIELTISAGIVAA